MPAHQPVSVRRVVPGDAARWRELFGAYIDFYKADVPGDVIAHTWSRLVARDPAFIGLVAVDAGNVPQGLVIAVLHPSTWSATGYCYLEDLFVDPAARGHGLGRALIEAIYREADAAGATRTYWMTEAGNSEARQLYDRLATLAPYVQYRR
jgi:GNAT superfamily N-acetyltransferase